MRAAGKLLPAINESGARSGEVQDAVRLVAEAPDPAHLFKRYGGRPGRRDVMMDTRRSRDIDGRFLSGLPKEVRIALEMASHEEQERRALEGELALLEAAWREAEEVAQIADDMFLPQGATERLEELRRKA